MSKYFSEKWSRLEPYVPGEQPRDTAYVKLNTNESPWAPTLEISEDAIGRMRALNLYPDPTYTELREALAGVLTARSGVAIAPENITVSNGSDEVLSWAFAAWCDEACPAVFADITYGFYPVFAEQQRVPYVEVPLTDAFAIKVADYCTPGRKTIFIANPNAPTGLALPLSAIREILDANPGNVVVVDEAYVDFGGESAVCLVPEYPNLLVTQTFSKSRSFAGGRLGFGVAQTSLGLGLLVEKITDEAGNIAPTVADLARQGKMNETLSAQLDEFIEDLADAHVVLHDLSPSNIACGLNADGKSGLFLIDGFGVLPLVPVYAWSKRLNRRRIQRKYADMRAAMARRAREAALRAAGRADGGGAPTT